MSEDCKSFFFFFFLKVWIYLAALGLSLACERFLAAGGI